MHIEDNVKTHFRQIKWEGKDRTGCWDDVSGSIRSESVFNNSASTRLLKKKNFAVSIATSLQTARPEKRGSMSARTEIFVVKGN
jgi:hypothetical protein